MRFCFGGYTLDCDRYELRRGSERLDVQPKVWAFLRLLAEHSHRALPKDEIAEALWPDVVVAEGSLQRVASLARQVLDPSGEEIVRTVRGVGYQLAAPVEVEGGPERAPSGGATPAGAAGDIPEQQIRYCRTVDGVNVAWASVGSGPPLVRSLGWFTNLEREWSWAAGRRYWEKLARSRRLIRYDGRGMGLSDPAEEFSLETRLRDLEAVANASGEETFALIGMSEGCATAVQYAQRHPARVSRLVLYGPPSHIFLRPSPEMREASKALFSMVRAAWGGRSEIFGKLLAQLFVGEGAPAEVRDFFDRMQRASADRDTALRYLLSGSDLDLREAARQLRVPTLVVHRRGDLICDFEGGRAAAALIPNARLVPLPGDNHWPLVDDPGADAFFEVVDQFLKA